MSKVNTSVRQIIKDSIKEEKRGGQFSSNLDVWDAIPPIVDSIQFNADYVRELLEHENGGKPLTALGVLNKLLGLFGIQAIKKENLEVISLAPTDAAPQDTEALLCVDEAKLSEAFGTLAEILAKKETDAAKAREFQMTQNNERIDRINALEREMNELRETYQYWQDTTLRNVQDLCSLNRENDAIIGWAKGFLSGLAMQLVWSNEGIPEQLDVRFTTMKTLVSTPEKPCIMKGDTVILKGVTFGQVTEEGADPET